MEVVIVISLLLGAVMLRVWSVLYSERRRDILCALDARPDGVATTDISRLCRKHSHEEQNRVLGTLEALKKSGDVETHYDLGSHGRFGAYSNVWTITDDGRHRLRGLNSSMISRRF